MSKLGTPSVLKTKTLRITALGGLGEIGRNMTVFEYGKTLLIVDAGVLFPDEHQPGVDLILPDFSHIRDRLDKVAALLLTHGHEDHIGAVPYLLRENPNIAIYGTALTLALVAKKLKEAQLDANLHVVTDNQVEKFGPFTCEFVAVNHSIPDAVAVSLTTPAGTVLHTGDFKMDQFPLDGRITDLRTFARLGQAGVDLFLTDSTNADVAGFTVSEQDLLPAIEHVFSTSKKRIIVSSFASHIHRIQQIVNVSASAGRQVAFYGRSMVTNMDIAQQLGYLTIPAGVQVEPAVAEKLPPHKVVLICTGSQGEPMAALARMANRRHHIKISRGDTVLMASSVVPGNENAVSRIIDALTKCGANVIHKGNANVHTSGHASAGELAYCYNIVKPTNVMPVHGHRRHLHANADLAEKTGVRKENIIVADNGDVVDLRGGRIFLAGHVHVGHVYVENSEHAQEQTVADRRTLSTDGVITVVVMLDTDTGNLVEEPDLLIRGLTVSISDEEKLTTRIRTVLLEAAAENITDVYALEHLLVRTVRRWADRKYRRTPIVIPVIIDA